MREVDFTAPGAVDPSDFGLDGLTSAAARLSVDLSPTSGLGASRLGQVRRADAASLSAANRSWFSLRTAAGAGVLLVDQSLAVVVADLLMGGSGRIDPRPLTSVEERVLVPHLQRAMGPLSAAFSPSGVGPLEIRDPGRGALGLRGDTLVVEIQVARDLEEDSDVLGSLLLVVPAPVSTRSHHRAGQGDSVVPGMAAFMDVPLRLSVVTDGTVVPADRIRSLAVDEVLTLRHRSDTPLRVAVGGVDVATGVLGRHEDVLTVQLASLLALGPRHSSRPARLKRTVPMVFPQAVPVVADGESTVDALDSEGDEVVSEHSEVEGLEAALAAASDALEGAGVAVPVTPTVGNPPVALGLLADVPVEVSVEIGRASLSLRDAVSLSPGQVVTLDAEADSLATVLVNGRVVARGQVVVVDDVYGVRVTELVGD